MENILIEMPVEVQNRVKSKAVMAWGDMERTGKETADEMYIKARAHFLDMYHKLSSEKYFAVERAKEAQSELLKEMEVMKDKIIKLQIR